MATRAEVERRNLRELPYSAEHLVSMQRAMVPIRFRLAELLRWFREGMESEVPDAIHTSESSVWHQYVRAGESGGGGSLLGSPAYVSSFRSFLEDSPKATDYDDQVYVRPMRAAIANLAGFGPTSAERPFMAHYLFALSCLGYDWRATARALDLPEGVARVYTHVALATLYGRYDQGPHYN